MEFLKNKIGILVALLCLIVIGIAIWYFLAGSIRPTTPEGTLVWQVVANGRACL